MQETNFEEVLAQILEKDQRYHRDAYVFLRESLDFTQELLKKEGRSEGKHVTPQQLLDGLRRYALQEFGPMAKTVLGEWGVNQCGDLGNMVFNLVDIKYFAKTDSDSREDFQAGYDFTEAFSKPFWPAERLRDIAAVRTGV